MARKRPEPPLAAAPANLYLLFCGLALATLPHTGRLPWWVNSWIVLLFLWRVNLARSAGALPRRLWLVLLAVAGVLAVLFTYRTIFGRDAGVTLLVLLISLKLMEMKLLRDAVIVVFLAYFLCLTGFFYSQTMPAAALMVLTVLAISASLVGFNDPGRSVPDNARTAAVLLLQASPVMLLLFFLFPRVPGPLWGLPQDAFAGVTGLSDSMSPGSISRLSQSDAIAFRALFDGPLPPRRQLYWRGPVLWDFDGTTWRVGSPRFLFNYSIQAEGMPLEYSVTLEPHNRNWLFALDLPASIPRNARITHDYQLWSLPLVRNRVRYEMRSSPNYRALAGAAQGDLREALALPAGSNPRARRLAADWRARAGTGADAGTLVLRQAIDYFRSAGLEYTLTPPLLAMDTVDAFLFDTRQGFCEHFAAAFTFLMRAAGVPARIVTGYQGGEVNPVDGYLEVRQADAHAWSEIWLPEAGWTRVDPTATAVPIRVDSGLAAAVPRSAALPLLMRADAEWLRRMRYNWSALANQWNQWILGYNADRQREMLSFFGVRSPDWRTLALLLFWSVASVLGLTALWLLSRLRRRDPVLSAWQSFREKLARAGVAPRAGEGPVDFGTRAMGSLPESAGDIEDITRGYVEYRYGRSPDPAQAARLRRLVRSFSP